MLHNICMSAVTMSLRWANCGPWASCISIQQHLNNTKFTDCHAECELRKLQMNDGILLHSGPHQTKKMPLNKMRRFRLSCTCAKYHLGLFSLFLHRLCRCTIWSWPLLSTYAQRCGLAWHSSSFSKPSLGEWRLLPEKGCILKGKNLLSWVSKREQILSFLSKLF